MWAVCPNGGPRGLLSRRTSRKTLLPPKKPCRVDVPSGGDQTVATWDLLLYDSKDEGRTWINERWLRAKDVGGGGCIVPSRIAELEDGSLFLAASYFAKPGNVEILDYYRSIDRGETWEFIGQPRHFPPHCLSEPSPIQLADGRLFVIARESCADGLQGAKGFSTDGGKTWKYQQLPFPITGRTCLAGLLQDEGVEMTKSPVSGSQRHPRSERSARMRVSPVIYRFALFCLCLARWSTLVRPDCLDSRCSALSRQTGFCFWKQPHAARPEGGDWLGWQLGHGGQRSRKGLRPPPDGDD